MGSPVPSTITGSDPGEPRERRKGRRRSGAVLDKAIFEATMTELAEVGYSDFSIERVAGRAGTGKAAVYRRWAGRAELVAAAVRDSVAGLAVADSGDLRVDLLALFGAAAELLAGPAGEAARGLVADTRHTPALTLAIRSSVPGSGHEMVLEILRRGAVRGEVRPQALTPGIAGVGPALLRQHFLMHGAPIPSAVLTQIVDEIVLPLVRS
jgi:AcrR family transcriptional regulator